MPRYKNSFEIIKGDNGNEKELTKVFSKYGKLCSVWVAQRPAGFAFIEYEDNEDAEGEITNNKTFPDRAARYTISFRCCSSARWTRNLWPKSPSRNA